VAETHPPGADEGLAISPALEFRSLAGSSRLSDRVAKMMQDAIVSRNLEAGTQLPTERELGEQFGVSRTVVREAIRILVAKGIVDVRSGSGLRVAAVDPLTVTQSLSWFIRGGKLEYSKVHEVRDVIEVEMAGLAAERRTDDQLAELRRVHERFAALLATDVEAAAWADVEFHNAIAGATGNELYSTILESIADALIDVRRELLATGQGPDTVAHHEAILERIEAGDAGGARAAMHWHLEAVRREHVHDAG
jgi:GntR family transcriptional regulator, transcriptional repressor for pyruvate dehydrogenase complex